MTEEVHTQPLSRGKSRRERVEHARSRDILDVANELHMELTQSGRDYRWKEHDSMVISPDKNLWKWYSRNQGGDVITLVQTMKEIDFNQAIDYLNDGRFKEFTTVERVQEPFSYYLQPYEQTFVEGRQYLKEKRGLSDETIDFFWEKGVLAQANAKLNDSIEPVVVFKTLSSGEVTGANLQGIKEDWVKWPKRGYAKHIIRNSDGLTGLHVDIGQPKRLVFTESPIDLMSYYELKKDNLTDVRLISMDGLKESTIGRHLAQLQSELSGRPLRWSAEELAEGLQTAIDNGFFTDGKHADWITLAVDNDTGGRNFIDSLKEKGASINEDLPDLRPGQEKADWNDALKNTSVDKSYQRRNPEVVEEVEKPLDHYQEAVISSEQHKKNEINIGVFSEQAREAAPLPEATESQPLKDLSPSQSESHSLLHFTIENPKKSIYKDNYHPIKPYELNKLNHHAENLQKAAQWYLESLSDTTLHYFYQQENKQYNISIDFEQYHFMHLTGLFPLKKGQTAIKTLHDFAEGKGNYDNIMIANKGAAFQKIKVLPDLKAIMETNSFYFDQVEDILDLHSLSMEQAIKSDDKDILLALSSNEENIYPASLMELTKQLQIQTEQSQHQNVILGVYQERDGEFTQLSINEEYITDNGEEMLVILKGQQDSASDEPSHDLPPSPAASIIDAATFTKVLDTAYNVGNPAELGIAIPEEFRATWERYNQLSEESSGDFKTIIAKADELGFLDKTSVFYQDWQQDQIYNETYHVRLKWAESWPDGPQLPFNETELIEYRTFSEELYKQNNAFYALHQESKSKADPVTNEGYIPFTKVKFSVHAPGGELIKEIRYDIGDETKPISQLLGLGYRRLEGQSELAAIDEEVLAQLENYELNQEIATEANEATLPNQEPLLENDNSPRGSFRSPQQEMRANLAQQVKEIVAEELVNNQNNESGQVQKSSQTPTELFDYTSASADEISKHAFQKIREYTQSPEDFMEYVNFMSKFPQLSPRNVALIHEQWRSANAVATYDQWQAMGEALGVKPEDVIQTKATYTNKRTGETKEVVHQGLSVKTGEKSQITLFRPLMVKMIPVLDETGHQVKNDKGNLKYKKLSEATPQEKSLVKEGKLPVREFQQRNSKTGSLLFTTYKVFELSQTTLKPESYPKAMPNRHYNFNTDKVKTKEVLEGLCDYAESIGVKMMKDEAHVLGNAKGAFFPEEQLILINPDNTPGEKIATTIHELAHATLHNSKLDKQYKNDIPKGQKELEAEMTSHLLSKHFGLDTSEKAIHYIAGWTENLTMLDDKQLANSLQRVHKTVSKMLTKIEAHTKPYQPRKNKGQSPNFPKIPTKGPNR